MLNIIFLGVSLKEISHNIIWADYTYRRMDEWVDLKSLRCNNMKSMTGAN